MLALQASLPLPGSRDTGPQLGVDSLGSKQVCGMLQPDYVLTATLWVESGSDMALADYGRRMRSKVLAADRSGIV